MASILLTVLCAATIGAAPLPAQADTTDVYMIDNVEIKNFNGSQLNGKTIATYNINVTTQGSAPVRVHIIKTVPSMNSIRISAGSGIEDYLPIPLEEIEDPVFFLDGVRISELAFKSLDTSTITNVGVKRDASAAEYLRSLSSEGKYVGTVDGRGVILVETKK